MRGVQIPIRVASDAPQPLQQQLIQQFQQFIDDGTLKPGDQIPSSRSLSQQLGIARNTVVLAYEHLISQGFLEAKSASATFVSRRRPTEFVAVAGEQDEPRSTDLRAPFTSASFSLYIAPTDRLALDFRVGRTDSRLFPRKAWQRMVTDVLGGCDRAISEYPHPAGLPALRRAISDYLRIARGVRSNPDQVIIVGGAQEGLTLAARLTGVAGRRVLLEDPCYRGAAAALASQEALLTGVPVDREGLVVDQLPPDGASLAYITPSHQFPTGVTLSLQRRRAILAWAEATSTYLLEDDYDSDFRYSDTPLMALQAIDRSGRVLYLGTFSKTIGPGVRLGFLVVPEIMVGAATALKAVMDAGQAWFDQAILASFLRTGAFAMHLLKIRRAYLRRRDALIAALSDWCPDGHFDGIDGGMHLAWTPPGCWPSASRLKSAASAAGVGVYTMDEAPSYRFKPHSERALLFGYPALTEARIELAIRRFRRSLEQR